MSLIRRPSDTTPKPGEVMGRSLAFIVKNADVELGISISLLGSLQIPLHV
jgi:hypothetical protein